MSLRHATSRVESLPVRRVEGIRVRLPARLLFEMCGLSELDGIVVGWCDVPVVEFWHGVQSSFARISANPGQI